MTEENGEIMEEDGRKEGAAKKIKRNQNQSKFIPMSINMVLALKSPKLPGKMVSGTFNMDSNSIGKGRATMSRYSLVRPSMQNPHNSHLPLGTQNSQYSTGASITNMQYRKNSQNKSYSTHPPPRRSYYQPTQHNRSTPSFSQHQDVNLTLNQCDYISTQLQPYAQTVRPPQYNMSTPLFPQNQAINPIPTHYQQQHLNVRNTKSQNMYQEGYSPQSPINQQFVYSPMPQSFCPFSTKLNFDPVNEEHGERNEVQANSKKCKTKKSHWTSGDSKNLVYAHINVSGDTYLGTSQCGNTFWGKVTECFNREHNPATKRTIYQCKNHFNKASQKCQKFSGAYHQAIRNKQSGQSDIDIKSAAYDIYLTKEGKKFTIEHIWEILRNEPKWRAKYYNPPSGSASSGSKRNRDNYEGVNSITSSNPNTSTSAAPSTEFTTRSPGKHAQGKCDVLNATMSLVDASSHSLTVLSHSIDNLAGLDEERLRMDARILKIKEEKFKFKKWSQLEKLSTMENRTPPQERWLAQLSAELCPEDE